MVEQFSELCTEERADNGRRSLVATQTVGIGSRHDRRFQQSVVFIDCHKGLNDEGDETQVLLGCLTGSMQQYPIVGRQAPVVVFTRTVDAVEGLFVQQHAETVVACHLLHQRHEQHVVVHSQIALLKDRCQFKLVGGNLVMACLDGNGQFEGLNLQVLHKGLYAVRDGAEVVVVHLLVLGTLVPHQCASCHQQVGAGRIEPFVHEKVFLFPTEVDLYLLHIVIEETADLRCSLVNSMECTQQRSLVVESLAGIGNEYGGNTECVVNDEHRACGVPCRVAASLECVADTAVGETGCIRFLLNQQFTAECLNHTALAVVLHEGVVFLGSAFGQGLEPVRIVCNAHFHGPPFHAFSNSVSYGAVQSGTVINHVDHLLIDVGR